MRAEAEQQLEREIALLRQQLALAEEMRRAIVDDEVDAFVIGRNGADPKLVLLETARPGDATLLEHVHEGAVTVSESGDVLYANRRFATLAGRSLSQLFGKPLREVVARSDRARFDAFLTERALGSVFDAVLSAEGAQVAVRFALVSVGNGHASLVVNDLAANERLMEAESALRAIRDGEVDGVVVAGEHVLLIGDAHRPYRALADRMAQGAATVSAQGDVLYANDRFASMVGVAREQLVGKPISPLLEGDREVILALIAGATVGAAQCELAIVRADGSLLPVRAAAQHLDGVDAITLVLTDLTEHNRHRVIEEEARRKDRFLAELGHELRNPLASIRNATEILRRRLTTLGSDERLSVEVIGRQTATLVRLIDDLLDIHRLNEGKFVLRLEPVQVAIVIRNAIEAAQPYLQAKGQTLDLALPDEPVFVHADAVRLVQVLLNLLSNATKFTAEGGRIVITLERARRASGDEVARIRVADNGIGVAPELLDRIFDAYMQVTPSDESGGTGLGLGLSVARRLVALHGGSIRADSQGPGRGTTFTLELATCAPPADVVANGALVEEAPKPKLRILVADDSEDSAQSLATALRVLGHDTRTARDGHEALAIADDFRPDVAVLDIDMPALDAYETARALRQRPWDGKLVLCALTALGQQADRLRAHEAGFDSHFVKPISPDVLAHAIEAHWRSVTPPA
jgi:PAS domain S-box-containing protein